MIKKSNQNSSDTTALYVLIAMICVFVVLLTNGWSKFLLNEPIFAAFPPLAYLGGLAVAAIGVILAKGVASERLRVEHEENPKFKNTWIAYFMVLFMFSAVGTMNFLFNLIMAGETVEQTISQTVQGLNTLETKSKSALPTPLLDKKRTIVEATFRKFEAEIKNPLNCGMGVASIAHYTTLKRELPNMAAPSGSAGQKCEKIDELLAGYKSATENALSEWVKTNLPDEQANEELLKEVRGTITPIVEDLQKIQSKDAKDRSVYREQLTKAWNAYETILNKVELKSQSKLDIQRSIKNADIESMGRFITVLVLLVKNFNSPTTYLILFLSVLVDVVLISAYGRHLVSTLEVTNKRSYQYEGSRGTGSIGNPMNR